MFNFNYCLVNFGVVLLLGFLSLLAGRPLVYRTPPRLGENDTCCILINRCNSRKAQDEKKSSNRREKTTD
jgi:hypothetical protein